MEIRYLLKSQRHQLFEAVTAAGLEPTDFEWQDTDGHNSGARVSKLVHKSSGYEFVFDNLSDFYSQWTPGRQSFSGSNWSEYWTDQYEWFRNWLSYVRREVETPDVWRAIAQETQVLESAAASDTSNAPFTDDEKAYIRNGLNEIKQYLLTAHRLDPELVESRLKYLTESAERLGRKDWLNILISTLVNIVINAALPPETTRELFRFAGTVLRQIINQPLLLS